MQFNYIKIRQIKNGFEQKFKNNIIEKITYEHLDIENPNNKSSICKVYFHDNSSKEFLLKYFCCVYNNQYGIPVSEDGRKLFIGTWDKGLIAYDIASGKIIWKYKPSKIRNIFVYSKYLIVARTSASIVKLDIETGKLLAEIKSGTLEHIYDLGYPYIFAETISGKHSVVDIDDMLIVKKYNPKEVNPKNILIFHKVFLQDNNLIVSGVNGSKKISKVIDSNFFKTN